MRALGAFLHSVRGEARFERAPRSPIHNRAAQLKEQETRIQQLSSQLVTSDEEKVRVRVILGSEKSMVQEQHADALPCRQLLPACSVQSVRSILGYEREFLRKRPSSPRTRFARSSTVQ